MNFAQWQELGCSQPQAAARELLNRIARIPTEQRRAMLAYVPSENDLIEAFEAAAKSPESPLRGIPFAVKDLFDVAGLPTLAGSVLPARRASKPSKDSALVAELRSQGAVFAAKTHLHEFAYGLTGENAHYGHCEHPHHPGRTAGGSSSGSAALVAAGVTPLALGTDTGGSVRVPAAFCGLFGFRMTPRDRFIADAFPLAPSFDTAGFFTRTAPDLQVVIDALIDQPPHTIAATTPPSTREPRGLWLGFTGLVDRIDPNIARCYETAANRFATPADSATSSELLECFRHASSAYAVLQSTEAYQLHASFLDSQKLHYSPEVWKRIDRGRRWTATQLTESLENQAKIISIWRSYFANFDFLVMPATHAPALSIVDCTLQHRLELLALTTPASLGGLPVLSIPYPIGEGFTAGLQIIVPTPQSSTVRWAIARN